MREVNAVNDEAISLIDSDNVIFYDDRMEEKIYFVFVKTIQK